MLTSPKIEKIAPPRLIISGAPASGKGTQCEFIKKDFGVVHLSTGDMLRAAVESGSELGQEAQRFMNSGKLVPDALIIGVVIERLKERDCEERGWLLDGFPRSKGQADALFEAGIDCDIFIQLDVDDNLLVERVVGRRMDPVTGKIYHLKYSPPPNDPEILARLEQRSDDTEEKCSHRIRAYNQNLRSITDKYKDKIVRINGNRSPLAVWSEIRSVIPRAYKQEVVFLLSSPGIDDGSLGKTISEGTGYVHISVDGLIRVEAENNSEAAEVIKKHQAEGSAIPPEILVGLIAKTMKIMNANAVSKKNKQRKFLIDGFPTNMSSMKSWYTHMSTDAIVDLVIYLECPEGERHTLLTDKLKASVRPNEIEALVASKLDDFNRNTTSVLESFDRLGRLRTVDATLPQALVLKQAKRFIESICVLPSYQRTFAMIKPDAVTGGHIKAIQEAIIAANLNIISSKLIHMDEATVDGFYSEHIGKSFYDGLKEFMSSGSAVAMVLEGVDAVSAWRMLMGPTNTFTAQAEAPKSLRAKFGLDGTRNAVHGSDSELSASREIDFFMSPNGGGMKSSLANEVAASASLGRTKGGLPNQETFIMIKPIASTHHYDAILSVIVGHGFEIVSELRTKLSKTTAGKFYAEHYGKPFFDTLVDYMTSGEIVAMHLKRPAAISAWRYLIGPTNINKAQLERPNNCIRSLFAIDGTKNAVHGSDSITSAAREINFFFPFQADAPVFTPPAPPAIKSSPLASPINSPSKKVLASPERKGHHLPSLSKADVQVMKQYSLQEISPIIQPLCEQLMIKRPKNVAEFAINELNRMLSSKLEGGIDASEEGAGWDDLSIASDEALHGGL